MSRPMKWVLGFTVASACSAIAFLFVLLTARARLADEVHGTLEARYGAELAALRGWLAKKKIESVEGIKMTLDEAGPETLAPSLLGDARIIGVDLWSEDKDGRGRWQLKPASVLKGTAFLARQSTSVGDRVITRWSAPSGELLEYDECWSRGGPGGELNLGVSMLLRDDFLADARD